MSDKGRPGIVAIKPLFSSLHLIEIAYLIQGLDIFFYQYLSSLTFDGWKNIRSVSLFLIKITGRKAFNVEL